MDTYFGEALAARLAAKRVVDDARDELGTQGYFTVQGLLTDGALRRISEIWADVSGRAQRRTATVTYSGITSTRDLHTISSCELDGYASEIEALYYNSAMLSLFSAATDRTVVPLDDPIERYVMNALTAEGAHHGLHVDSFPFACSIIIEQPTPGDGGRLEIASPQSPSEMRDVDMRPGDLVFFRSGELKHQVTALRGPARRVVLNMAYATPETKAIASNTRDVLYGG